MNSEAHKMVLTNPSPTKAIWQEDPFDIIKPKDYEILGINPDDIPPGAYAAHRHPTLLSSRFGGNA
ncbi:MAG TPA: hypothetical protein VJ373_08220, partial [Desulfatiglandales bacterium]|nr:hypothetical protein [Desulfatiglandales bacterium]